MLHPYALLPVLAASLCLAAAAPFASAAPTEAEAAVLDSLATRATRDLEENILPFWIANVRDTTQGGYHGEVRQDLTVNDKAPRGALMVCRILWTYSAALGRDPRPEYRDMARRALEDLDRSFWDVRHGGLYWTGKPDGSPLATHKQVYLQAFGINALSEYHRTTGNGPALERAKEIFRLLEDKARDPQHGGYLEAFTRDWTKELPEMRRLIGGNAPKSQNTHLHLMEAYASLLRVWPDPGLRAALGEVVGLMLDRILDPTTHHLGLYFEADWTPASKAISYGHDIEAAWLLCDAAEVLGDEALLARTREVAVQIARLTLAEGVSPLGGIYSEGGPAGVTNAEHEWWPQAEAVVGFLHAYQLSGDTMFLDGASQTWDFIENYVIDHKDGEWFLMVDAKGKPQTRRPKASIWKCPYHNGRACMQIADRVKSLQDR